MKRTIVHTLWIVLLSVWNLSTAYSADPITQLNRFFDRLEEHNRLMGNVAVLKDGNVVYTRSLGYAHLDYAIQANEHTKYRIGSISKTFTSVLVLKAVEEQKLNFRQTIESFFPNLPNADQIMIADLLRHRSGIHNFTDDPNYLTWHQSPKSKQHMIDLIVNAGSDFSPGERSQYSNSNYVLLSFILENVMERSYRVLLQEYITHPLRLNDTYYGGTINPEKNESLSYGYAGKGIWKVASETDLSIPQGAGGIVSTAQDLVKFSDALFSGKLLKEESLKYMKTVDGIFGAGLIPIPFHNTIGYGHTGGIDGFHSVFIHFPDSGISYALTANGLNFDVNQISMAVLSAFHDMPVELPVFSSIELTENALKAYKGRYQAVQVPMTLRVFIDDGSLHAQAEGQPAFPLEPVEEHVFKFDPAGVRIEFNLSKNSLQLEQGGFTVDFNKSTE